MVSNPIYQSYKKLIQLLSKKQKKKGAKVLMFSIILGLADLIAISVTVPILVLTIDKSFLEKSSKMRWIYAKAGMQSEGDFLLLLIGIILLFFIVKNIFGVWYRSYIKDQCTEIASIYAEKLYHKYLSRGYLASAKLGTSEMIDKLIYYPFQLSHGIIFPFVTLLTELIAIALIVGLILLYKPLVFIVLISIMLPSLFLIFKFTRKKLYALGKESDLQRAETIKGINIGLQGFEDIKFNDVEKHFLNQYKGTVSKFIDSNLRSLIYQYIPSRFNEIIAVVGLVVFAIFGYFFSDNVGGTRVLAALFALAIFRLVPALNKVLASLMSLKTYQRVLEEDIYLGEEEKLQKPEIIFDEEIVLKKVGFRFEDSEKSLFENLDLSIKKGSKVGIYGESGNGKSTLLKIITGIIPPMAGSISIDGIDLSAENAKIWQNQIAYVSQNPFILHGTLKENIALGEEQSSINESKMIQAIKDASLDVFFSEWKENLDIDLGEAGAFISEGQKQRVCIARALYKNVNTLVLDEATSALDEENEKYIQETILKLTDKNYTILIIAHKKSFLSICDALYKLEDGNLILDNIGIK